MESMTLSTRTPQESQSNRETAQKHEIKAQNLPPFPPFLLGFANNKETEYFRLHIPNKSSKLVSDHELHSLQR